MRRWAIVLAAAFVSGPMVSAQPGQAIVYPEHINARTQLSIRNGLDYLAKSQARDGSWTSTRNAYPVTVTSLAGLALLANGNTPSRGAYADQVKKTSSWLMSQANKRTGMITSGSEESGRPMYGHGFALTFLASVYGMETNEKNRDRMKGIISRAVQLVASAQSPDGGWTYTPGGGDEGSVTVTQLQALRAAENAGFTVPKGTIEKAIRYIQRCRTADGGIRYSLRSGGQSQIAISAATVAALYNAGEYEAPVAEDCLAYVDRYFKKNKKSFQKGGHSFYTHFYGAQAFYMADDKYWNDYFPTASKQFLDQQKDSGQWDGDGGIGPVYGTSIALIILQLPYKFLPIYQR